MKVPTTDYMPTVDQVAQFALVRTRDKWGNEVGTFTADTRPTDTQVAGIIVSSAERVADVIGDDIPAVLFDDAAEVVAERSAMQIELDFYPEQVSTGRSPYDHLEKQYQSDLATLGKQVQILLEGGELKAISAEPSNQPLGSFPDATQFPPFGLGTRW